MLCKTTGDDIKNSTFYSLIYIFRLLNDFVTKWKRNDNESVRFFFFIYVSNSTQIVQISAEKNFERALWNSAERRPESSAESSLFLEHPVWNRALAHGFRISDLEFWRPVNPTPFGSYGLYAIAIDAASVAIVITHTGQAR